jgi:hypothetical protein
LPPIALSTREVVVTGPRVVMYGVGAMGSLAARMILEKGGEIVGAVARSPEKVGRDIAEVASLPAPLGVPVRADAAELLRETRPDIVVMTIASYMGDVYDPVRICLEQGVDVLSLSEELLYSWLTNADRTAELDALARSTGATLTCSGHQDGYWVGLVSTLMGTAHRVERVTGAATWNVDDFGPELARDQMVGATPEEFSAWVATAVRPPTFGRTTLHSLAAVAGLTVVDSETSTRPEVAKAPAECRALGLTVEPGQLIGFTDVDTVRTAEGPVLVLEMTGKVYSDTDNDGNYWTVIGEPTVELRNDVLPTHLTTCSTLVNRIPDVLAAEPGYRTLDQLPPLRFRSRL